jgi:phage tail sheath protein FI
MPLPLTYPGVYIEEIPSGVRTITGVATSITAFVGRALRGPVNEPVFINSFGDFERIFGGLWVESTLGYAVKDFYLNGGSQAIIVRLLNPNFATDAERDLAIAAANAVADAAKAAADVSAAKTAAQAKANEYLSLIHI